MGTLLERIEQAKKDVANPRSEVEGFGLVDGREKAIIDRHKSELPGEGLLAKIANARAISEIGTRREQRSYAEKATPEVAAPVKEMLSSTMDRPRMLTAYRKLSPEQREEALKLAPGIAQQMGDDRGGAIGRIGGSVARGISSFSQPITELAGKVTGTDVGGTAEEIAFIRQMEAASQEFSPARPDDPWYQRFPLQAAEMTVNAVPLIMGGLAGKGIATAGGQVLARGAAAGVPGAKAAFQATGAVGKIPKLIGLKGATTKGTMAGLGTVAGITAAGFPGQYAQEIDQLKAIGMEDGNGMQSLAIGTALVTSALESIMPNPYKGILPAGSVKLKDGAIKAARQYMWEAIKRAPQEITEEYAQGLSSGLGKHVAQYIDENAEKKSIGDAFKISFEQGNAAIGPMMFMLGVPAVIGAGRTAYRAKGATLPPPPSDGGDTQEGPLQSVLGPDAAIPVADGENGVIATPTPPVGASRQENIDRVKQLKDIDSKGYVRKDEGPLNGIEGETRTEIRNNLKGELAELEEQLAHQQDVTDTPPSVTTEVPPVTTPPTPSDIVSPTEQPNNQEPATLMGTPVVLSGSFTDENNIRHELFEAENGDRGFVRSTDIDSGNVVSITKHPSVSSARNTFTEAQGAQKQVESTTPKVPAVTPEVTPATEVAKTPSKEQGVKPVEQPAQESLTEKVPPVEPAKVERSADSSADKTPVARFDNGLTITAQKDKQGNVVPVTFHEGREIVHVVDEDGRGAWFYRSFTGTGGKQQGRWYPIGGVASSKNGSRSWIIKGDAVNDKGFGRPDLAKLEDKVNEILPSSDEDVDKFLSSVGAKVSVENTKAPSQFTESPGSGPYSQEEMGSILQKWKDDYLTPVWGTRVKRTGKKDQPSEAKSRDTASPEVKEPPIKQVEKLPKQVQGELISDSNELKIFKDGKWRIASVTASNGDSGWRVKHVKITDPETGKYEAITFPSDAAAGYESFEQARDEVFAALKQKYGNAGEIGQKEDNQQKRLGASDEKQPESKSSDIVSPEPKPDQEKKYAPKTKEGGDSNGKVETEKQTEAEAQADADGRKVLGPKGEQAAETPSSDSSVAKKPTYKELRSGFDDYSTTNRFSSGADRPALWQQVKQVEGKNVFTYYVVDTNDESVILSTHDYDQAKETWDKQTELFKVNKAREQDRRIEESSKVRKAKEKAISDDLENRKSQDAQTVSAQDLDKPLTGKPIVVTGFHGSKDAFEEFDPSRRGETDPGFLGPAYYFYADETLAKKHGKNVIRRDLRIDKPLDYAQMMDAKVGSPLREVNERYDEVYDREMDIALAQERKGLGEQPAYWRARAAALATVAREFGYDGVVMRGGKIDDFPNTEIAVFSPPQKTKAGITTQQPDKLKQHGLKVERVGSRWVVSGKTFDNKQILKDAGGQYDGSEKNWWFKSDPTDAIADRLRDGGDGEQSSDGGDSDADVERKRVRSREAERPDERGTSDSANESVSADTRKLIQRGSKFGIPEKVLEGQVEDIGRVTQAFEAGKPMFLVGSAPGMGKSFILGGSIAEIRKRITKAGGKPRFIYVTENQELISQLKRDLVDYGLDDVEFVTYAGIRGVDSKTKKLKRPNANGAVVLIDEAHNAKKLETQNGEAIAEMVRESDFSVYATATPFENVSEAKYLEVSGIFDGVEAEVKRTSWNPRTKRNETYPVTINGFDAWAFGYGAQLFWPKDAFRPAIYWDKHKTEEESQIQANEWLAARGIYAQRPMVLPPNMVKSELRAVTVDDKYVQMFDDVLGAYASAETNAENAAEAGQIRMHGVNLQKRMLEAAKVQDGIRRAKELIDEGKQVIIFVNTKSDRAIGRYANSDKYLDANKNISKQDPPLYQYPEIAEANRKWQEEFNWVKKNGGNMKDWVKANPRPFAGMIERIAEATYNADIDFTLPSVIDDLLEALGDNAVDYTGQRKGLSDAQAKVNLTNWKAGNVPVIVATMAKGGTGLSYHDTTGKMPERVQLGINLPWSGTEVEQVSGRLARLGTAKPVGIEWIFADNISFERELSKTVGSRMRSMQASVQGSLGAMAQNIKDFEFGDAPAAPREPWQMTLDEYVRQQVYQKLAHNAKRRAAGLKDILSDKQTATMHSNAAKTNHVFYVKQAIEEGKSVPQEVLADYPNLKAELSEAEQMHYPRVKQIQDSFHVDREVAIVTDILLDLMNFPREVEIARPGAPMPGGAETQISKASAKMKATGEKYPNESIFFRMWDKFLRAVGGKRLGLKSTKKAVGEAIEDMATWMEENPRFVDYYSHDNPIERAAITKLYPELGDDANWALYKIITAVASPGTNLDQNTAEQINAWGNFRENNFERFDVEFERSERGHPTFKRSGFQIHGAYPATKALHYSMLNEIIKQQGGIEQAVKWLVGTVPASQIRMLSKEVGGGETSGKQVQFIRQNVEFAWGNAEQIPRMFIFGPKEGAYALNHLGQHEFTTVDVWESRFWRSFFKDVPVEIPSNIEAEGDEAVADYREKRRVTGIEEDLETRGWFLRAGRAFAEALDMTPAEAQAVRWFYVIQQVNEAGYGKARSYDTISGYTAREVAKRQAAAAPGVGGKKETSKPRKNRRSSSLRNLLGDTIFGEEVTPDTLYQEQPGTRRIDMSFKDVTKRIPELQKAAKLFKDGKLSKEGYSELVDKFKPVVPYSFVPEPATTEDATRALSGSKREAFGNTAETIPAGDAVELRLDIPAYKDHGVWINSIHRNVDGKRTTSYDSYSAATDIDFRQSPGNQRKALDVATGDANKSPFAVIKGKWNPVSKEDAVKRAKEALASPEWAQVGYDPERHSYFYDRTTMEPLESAAEVIQIGPLVLAKNPTYGEVNDVLFQQQRTPQGTVQAWTHFVRAAKALVADKAIIGGTDKADVSSPFHELGHPMREFLFNRNVSQEERGNISLDDIIVMEEFIGVEYDKKGKPIWERKDEEKFVDALMKYWREGTHPNKQIETIFQKISKWLSGVFSVIERTDKIELTDEVRAIFAKVHERGGVDPKKLQALREAEESAKSDAAAVSNEVSDEDVESEVADAIGDIFGAIEEEAEATPVVTPVVNVPATEQMTSGSVTEVPIKDINVAPDRFQFKTGVSETTGAVEGEELQGDWDTLAAGVILLWQDATGELWAVNGHHRVELARRKNVPSITSRIVKETDGVTEDEARAMGAKLNILEGQGKVEDYADFFRTTRIEEADAERQGLLARAKGKTGFMVGRFASEDVWAGYRAGRVSSAQAAAISDIGRGNDGLQIVGLELAKKGQSADLIRTTLQAHKLFPVSSKNQQLDLFGFDDSAIREAEAIARAIHNITQALKDRLLSVKGYLKRPKQASEMGLEGNVQAIQEEAGKIQEELDRWAGWTTNRELIEQARIKAGLDTGPDMLFQSKPNASREAVMLAKEFLDGGGDTFEGYVDYVAKKWTKEKARELGGYLEETWKQVQAVKKYAHLPPVGKVSELLTPKPKPEAAKPEPPKPKQPAEPEQPDKPKPTGPRVAGVRTPQEPFPDKQVERGFYTDHELTGIAKAVMNDLRELAGIPELEAAPPETIKQWALDAQSTMAADPHAPTRLLNEIISNPARALDHHDVMLLAFRYRELANQAEPHFQEMVDASKSNDSARIAKARTNYILARQPMTEFEELTLKAKSTWGRTGIALQVMLRKDNTVEGLLRRAREANHGKPLSPEQDIEMRDLADRFKKLQEKLDEETARADKAEAEVASLRHLKDLVKESPTRKKPSKEQISALDAAWAEIGKLANVDLLFQRDETNPYHNTVQVYRDLGVETFAELRRHVQERLGKEQATKLEDKFKDAWEATKPETEVPANIDRGDLAQLTREARRIERSIVEGLMLDNSADAVLEMRDDIVDAVHAEMQELLDESFTHRQTMDALSAYGQFSRPSQETTDTLLRNLNAEVLKLRQIDQLGDAVARTEQLRADGKTDAEIADILINEGLLVAQTGLVRDTPTDRLRDLSRKYSELKKDIPASSEGRAGLLQTAVAAIERGLTNRIRDLNHAIKKEEPIKIGRKPSPTNPNIERLKAERDALLKEYLKQFPAEKLTPEQRLANAIKAAERSIEVIKEQIKSRDFDKAKTEALPDSPELTALKQRLVQLQAQRKAAKALELSAWEGEGGAVAPDPKEAAYRKAYIASLQNRIAKLQQFLLEGDFSPQQKKSPRILSKAELELKTQLNVLNTEKMKKMADYHLSHLKGIAWTADKVSEVLHLARAIETSWDLSALGRQGGLIALGHPSLAKNALLAVGKSLVQSFDKNAAFNKQDFKWSELEKFLAGIDSRKAELAFMHKLTVGEQAEFRLLAGLDLPSTDQAITRQEEVFQGRWGKFVPGVAVSSRLYTMILNKMRADMFDLMVERLGRQGKTTLEEAKVIADFVNVMTGRSNLGRYNEVASTLNLVFFAPRYVASRFQYLAMPFYLPFKGGLKANWQIKRAIYSEYARTAGGAALVLGLIALAGKLFWDDDDEDKPTVGADPTSSDFLKPKFGETRYDFLAGLQQIFVVSSRMAPELMGGGRIGDEKFSENTGAPFEHNRLTVAARFLRSKLAPGPGFAVTGLNGWVNVVGQKADNIFGFKVYPWFGTTAQLFAPLSTQSITDAFETQSVPVAAGSSILATLGVGMSTYGPKTEYMTGTPEERKEQIKKDLKKMKFDSRAPAYKGFLSEEKMIEVNERREDRKQTLVYDASHNPIRKNFKNDETYNKAVNKRDIALKDMKQSGMTHGDAIKLLIKYWEANNGPAKEWREDAHVYKKEVSDRLKQLRKEFAK